MSHAIQGHPRQMGHSEEFWHNMVHWRRKMPTHSNSLVWRAPWTIWKGKKIWHWKMSPHRSEGVQYATGEEQRAITNNSRKNEVAGPKQKWHSVVDVSGGESKVWCLKEQYCIGTWSLSPEIKINWTCSSRRWQNWTSTFWESVN